jgi:hypothetical protein
MLLVKIFIFILVDDCENNVNFELTCITRLESNLEIFLKNDVIS